MVTIYELLEVEEDASKEEIEIAYSRLVWEFRQDIKFDEETNKENEMILNKLKLAYEILTNDEKRKKYDYDLAQKRAENLIKNVSIPQSPKEDVSKQIEDPLKNKNEVTQEDVNVLQKQEIVQKQNLQEVENYQNSIQEDMLTKDEKNKIRKAAQKEFKQKLKKVQQAEAEYNEAYNKAYNDYLRKMGYQVKEPWTLKRVKRVLITVIVIILIAIIMWNIPPIRNMLNTLYEENFIIKAVVDLIKAVINAILGK